ncbi:MAG TPA: Crp/Fnr family transcriptional regulator [Myxococcales bacterium]|jgi:CRP-like cAMP-binding protein|nr:Crp/Fnr family transcriptional regulator [Myxococcales bacterium]
MAEALLERYTGSYPKGTVLFDEGEPGDRMFVIHSGRVEVVKRVGSERLTIAELGPGESVGEMAILDGQPRSASAVVCEDAVLVVLDSRTFESLIRQSGEIAVRILRKLSQRLREANRQIEGFVARNGTLAAVEALRGLAGPEREGLRPLPLGTSARNLGARVGVGGREAETVWQRLRAAGVIVERDGEAALAPDPRVEEYLAYLDLKQRYDPLTVRELSEVSGLPEGEVHRVVRRMLASRLQAEQGLVDPYQHFLSLKKRFEYLDRV